MSSGQSTTSQAELDLVDLADLESRIDELRERYAAAQPFPHIVLDDIVEHEALARAYDELDGMPNDRWNSYLHYNERKYSHTDPSSWGPTLSALSAVFASDRFLTWLSDLTGFDGLHADPSLDGGGLHRSYRNGFLNVHADFTAHHHVENWRRRINLLLYLNREWQPEWGGDLELWSTDMQRCESTVAPVGGRMLLFSTDETSFHGHPDPLRSPEGVARQSLALYYFTEEANPVANSTDYRPRPDDGARRYMIYLDKKALAAYDVVKRRFKLSDAAVNRLLRPLRRRDR